jgi:hypothetical protein
LTSYFVGWSDPLLAQATRNLPLRRKPPFRDGDRLQSKSEAILRDQSNFYIDGCHSWLGLARKAFPRSMKRRTVLEEEKMISSKKNISREM